MCKQNRSGDCQTSAHFTAAAAAEGREEEGRGVEEKPGGAKSECAKTERVPTPVQKVTVKIGFLKLTKERSAERKIQSVLG